MVKDEGLAGYKLNFPKTIDIDKKITIQITAAIIWEGHCMSAWMTLWLNKCHKVSILRYLLPSQLLPSASRLDRDCRCRCLSGPTTPKSRLNSSNISSTLNVQSGKAKHCFLWPHFHQGNRRKWSGFYYLIISNMHQLALSGRFPTQN